MGAMSSPVVYRTSLPGLASSLLKTASRRWANAKTDAKVGSVGVMTELKEKRFEKSIEPTLGSKDSEG